MYRTPKAVVVLIGFILLSGCGEKPPPPNFKVAGTVTLDGKKIPEGFITFHPADKEGGASVSSPIIDGLYSAPVIPQGSYRVSFRTGKPPQQATGSVDSTFNVPDPKAKKDPIPEKYQKPSLPADVSADNPMLNFDLNSK